MSERYTKLFSLPPDLYAEGSPLIVSAGNLLKDNQTGNVLVQLKIKNISPKTVKAATVAIRALDTMGRPMDGDTAKEYLDLSVRQGEEFGQKAAIPLPNPSTRGFTVTVKEVVFADNSAYEGTDAPWEPLPAATPLTRTLEDLELVKQYELTFGGPCQVTPSSSDRKALSFSRDSGTTSTAVPFLTNSSRPEARRRNTKRATHVLSAWGGAGVVHVNPLSFEKLSISPLPVRNSIHSVPSLRSTAMCSAQCHVPSGRVNPRRSRLLPSRVA